MKLLKAIRITMTIVLFFSCGVENSDNSTRSFYMGFTPWPYAATTESIDNVYSFINAEGDLVAHHFQQGIPFTASNTLDFSTYDVNIRNEINDRINKTFPGKVIYLAIDSLNGARDDLTDLWGTSANMTRPSPWNSRSFDDMVHLA